jgi:hypothetical protein
VKNRSKTNVWQTNKKVRACTTYFACQPQTQASEHVLASANWLGFTIHLSIPPEYNVHYLPIEVNVITLTCQGPHLLPGTNM